MKIINPANWPKAVWPYSQAVKIGNLIYTSGQVWINPQTGKLEEGIENQTKRIFENLKIILKEIGCNLNDVVKTTIFLKNIDDFQKVNEIYAKYLTHKPARSTIEVSNLPIWALIEIEFIIYKN